MIFNIRPFKPAVFVMLLLVALLASCSRTNEEPADRLLERSVDAWTIDDWDDVLAAARDSTVSFHMWGGSALINGWVDGFVADTMRERYAITVRRIPMDAPVFVNRLINEQTADRQTGSIDLMWINGENFRRAKEGGILAGPIVQALPNVQAFVDPTTMAFDFGFPTDGFESPYGRAQFVFEYDTARTDPPRSFGELPQWVRANPGAFSYPEPADFTGSAFIRQVFIVVTGGVDQYLAGWDPELYAQNAPLLWSYLNDIKPYLWQAGRSYPRDLAALDGLFERAEVAINMSYTQANAQARIIEGRYPPTVRSFVMAEGSLFNSHFVAIAFNAPNQAAAMVLANFLASPDAQLSKNDPSQWGDFTVLDFGRLSEDDRGRFANLDLGEATLSPEHLGRYAMPEIPAEYLEALQRDWYEFVLEQ